MLKFYPFMTYSISYKLVASEHKAQRRRIPRADAQPGTPAPDHSSPEFPSVSQRKRPLSSFVVETAET